MLKEILLIALSRENRPPLVENLHVLEFQLAVEFNLGQVDLVLLRWVADHLSEPLSAVYRLLLLISYMGFPFLCFVRLSQYFILRFLYFLELNWFYRVIPPPFCNPPLFVGYFLREIVCGNFEVVDVFLISVLLKEGIELVDVVNKHLNQLAVHFEK